MAVPILTWGWTVTSGTMQQLYARTMPFPGLLAAAVVICWLTNRNRAPTTEHSSTMPPDTVSSLFPDRPIRPLPKRRLQERLSPEVAESIKYPPSLHHTPAPLIHYPPYTAREDRSPPRLASGNSTGPSQRFEAARAYTPRRGGTGIRPGEEIEIPSRSSLVTRASPEILSRVSLQPTRADQQQRPGFGPPPPPSVASSVDGYESFENTSNKKKRKIPSAADSALNFSHGLAADVDASSLDSPALSADELNDDRFYHNTPGYYVSSTLGSSAQGMSGSGRGRLGRVRNGRSPLRAIPDGNNAWPSRIPKTGTPLWASRKLFSHIAAQSSMVPICVIAFCFLAHQCTHRLESGPTRSPTVVSKADRCFSSRSRGTRHHI